MSKPAFSPDRLFDRPWRWGQPFARRTRRARRWCMTVLLLLLCGTLEATQTSVENPRVHLTENVDERAWNWHRLLRKRSGRTRTSISPTPPPRLPEILLRNARIQFSEIRRGRFVPLAYLAVD